MEIAFQQFQGSGPAIRDDVVLYTDENGRVWFVPRGHYIWTDIYEPWLAAGNTPMPPS